MDNENVVNSGGGDYSKVKKPLSEPDYKKRNPRYFCPICSRPISHAECDVSKGYFGACLYCNNDYFEFELLMED